MIPIFKPEILLGVIFSSLPTKAENTFLVTSTSLASNPTWSKVGDKGVTPVSGIEL